MNASPQILLSNLNQFGLSGKSFKFESFHFHAGTSSSSVGSEHSFNNVFQPMEVRGHELYFASLEGNIRAMSFSICVTQHYKYVYKCILIHERKYTYHRSLLSLLLYVIINQSNNLCL